jgi:Ras-related protein Rab-11A
MPKNALVYDYLFKIALIGDSGIGKSSILIRFTENDFRDDTSSTIGVDFKIVSLTINQNTNAKMQIWDTCGSERFKALTSSFIKSCPAFLLIFDITKDRSFKNLENWMNLIKENTSPKLLCLIGNKCDLEEYRQVSRNDAIKFADKNNLKYIETSAKTNENIENVFIYVAEYLFKEVAKKRNSTEINNQSNKNSFEIGGYKNIQDQNKRNENVENKSNQACC